MPLVAVNLSDRLLQEIRALIDMGRYATLEGFIEIGAFNQLALERGATPAEVIERGHRSAPREELSPRGVTAVAKTKVASAKSPSTNGTKKVATEKPSKVDVIEPVSEDVAKTVFSRFARITETKALPLKMLDKPQTADHIFGQVNRLFPFKLVCRWLTNEAANEAQWPKFTTISSRLADDASTIGSLLDDWDKSLNRDRGNELATALPRRMNNASLDRFLSQFVARITRASEVSPGAVCQYDFVRFNESTLALTDQGVAFAALDNPILDHQDKKAPSSLSDVEAEFLATHIRAWVPTEWTDMKTVLHAVESGKASPAEVATAVRKELPNEWTDSMVQTHVSGVIARLGDIRLLRRTWQGRNVKYELGSSDAVTKFLATEEHS
jgi:hypothetical protein